MPEEISTFRLYLMRLLYLLNFVMLGLDVWPVLLRHPAPWDPVKGVAFAFWAALSTMSAFGIRYPTRMVPLLLMQMVYKSIWLAAVAIPQWSTLRSAELTRVMIGGIIVDVVVIPWGHVFANYVQRRGERWRSTVAHDVDVTLGVVALLVLAALPLTAQSADPVIDQAKALISSSQGEQAIDLLEKAVAAKPNDAVRHYWLGSAYGAVAQEAGMFRMMSLAGKAENEFERAVALDPNFLGARERLMEFYLMAPGMLGGSVDKAREQATEIRKRDAMAGHHAFAAVAAANKDSATARAEYAAAVRENQASPKPHYWLGIFFMLTEKNYKAAGEEFDASLGVSSNYMPAHFQIGHLAALSGTNLIPGAEALKKYFTYKPADDDPPLYRAHYWLGLIYEKQGMKAEARGQFQTALRLRPGNKDAQEALKRSS